MPSHEQKPDEPATEGANTNNPVEPVIKAYPPENQAISPDSTWDSRPSAQFSFRNEDVELQPRGITGHPDVEDSGFRSGDSFCLAIQSKDPPLKGGASRELISKVEGLVLQKVGEGKEEFRRIGWFVASGDGARYFKRNFDSLGECIVNIV